MIDNYLIRLQQQQFILNTHSIKTDVSLPSIPGPSRKIPIAPYRYNPPTLLTRLRLDIAHLRS